MFSRYLATKHENWAVSMGQKFILDGDRLSLVLSSIHINTLNKHAYFHDAFYTVILSFKWSFIPLLLQWFNSGRLGILFMYLAFSCADFLEIKYKFSLHLDGNRTTHSALYSRVQGVTFKHNSIANPLTVKMFMVDSCTVSAHIKKWQSIT